MLRPQQISRQAAASKAALVDSADIYRSTEDTDDTGTTYQTEETLIETSPCRIIVRTRPRDAAIAPTEQPQTAPILFAIDADVLEGDRVEISGQSFRVTSILSRWPPSLKTAHCTRI